MMSNTDEDVSDVMACSTLAMIRLPESRITTLFDTCAGRLYCGQVLPTELGGIKENFHGTPSVLQYKY